MPPVIMVHGSTHTAACLESTPDGREGWAPYFVRQGISTYIVDQAGRGRSGFDESVIHEAAAMIRNGDVAERDGEDSQLRPDHRQRRLDGVVRPPHAAGLEHPDRHADPARRSGRPADRRREPRQGLLPRVSARAVDANIVVARRAPSRRRPAGPNNYYALEYYKQLVPNAEVTLPGSICATCDPKEIAPANTWTPKDLAELVEKLGGAIVATHSQSGIMGHHMVRILKERGHLDLLKGLITIEGSCSLPNSGLKAEDFDNIPYMALKGDYTASSEVCDTTVNAIKARRAAGQGTAKADYIKLDELGNPIFNGTTHMMMLGTNNLEVADVILNWADENMSTRSREAGRDQVNRKDDEMKRLIDTAPRAMRAAGVHGRLQQRAGLQPPAPARPASDADSDEDKQWTMQNKNYASTTVQQARIRLPPTTSRI